MNTVIIAVSCPLFYHINTSHASAWWLVKAKT